MLSTHLPLDPPDWPAQSSMDGTCLLRRKISLTRAEVSATAKPVSHWNPLVRSWHIQFEPPRLAQQSLMLPNCSSTESDWNPLVRSWHIQFEPPRLAPQSLMLPNCSSTESDWISSNQFSQAQERVNTDAIHTSAIGSTSLASTIIDGQHSERLTNLAEASCQVMAFGMVKKEENELAKQLRSDKLHEKRSKGNEYFYQSRLT